MKKIIAILGIAAALFAGVAISPNSGTAQASAQDIRVANSVYSTGSILTCGTIPPCHNLAPGNAVFETSTRGEWTALLLGPGWNMLYRYVLYPSNGGAPLYGNWEGAQGGSNGIVLDIDHEFGPTVYKYTVDVILDRA